MTARAHVLDCEVRRSGDGRLLAGGNPARMLRLSEAGASALDGLLAGEATAATYGLRDRLRGYGIIHPVPEAGSQEVSFVIPVRDGGEGLATLIEQLLPWGAVIVVDDGSGDGSGARAALAGAQVLTNSTGVSGPAAARNLGLAATATEFVAFIDADCGCLDDWARPLAGLLAEDERLGFAAPRVRSSAGNGLIARYESRRSPLDLGERPGLARPGTRIGYLPSAALVARRRAVLELGGFDETLRFGEDVDLIWRAIAGGWLVRYAPEVEVRHRPRGSLRGLARQRFDYGSSAAALDRRHPGSVSPVHVTPATALVGLAALRARGRRGAAAVGLAAFALVATPRRRTPTNLLIARLRARALPRAGEQLARAAARDWLPASALASAASGRARRVLLVALAIDAGRGASRDPRLLLPHNLVLRLVENAAYSAGLWWGALQARAPAALSPRLRRRT